MRRLLILRHAKAVPPSEGDDYDRQLSERGRDDALKIGQWMAGADILPDHATYSGSKRTLETFEIVARALARPFPAHREDALYEATRFLILGLLRDLPATARASLVVGHNPGMGEIANLLTGEGAGFDRVRMAAKFPTGALAVIAFGRGGWAGLAPRSGRLEHFVTPADL